MTKELCVKGRFYRDHRDTKAAQGLEILSEKTLWVKS